MTDYVIDEFSLKSGKRYYLQINFGLRKYLRDMSITAFKNDAGEYSLRTSTRYQMRVTDWMAFQSSFNFEMNDNTLLDYSYQFSFSYSLPQNNSSGSTSYNSESNSISSQITTQPTSLGETPVNVTYTPNGMSMTISKEEELFDNSISYQTDEDQLSLNSRFKNNRLNAFYSVKKSFGDTKVVRSNLNIDTSIMFAGKDFAFSKLVSNTFVIFKKDEGFLKKYQFK